MNGVTTEPSVMECSSAATYWQVNDFVTVDYIVCSPSKKKHRAYDDEGIIMGNELTDLEINFVQQLLKAQFTSINGLVCINSCRKIPVSCQRIPYETEFRFCLSRAQTLDSSYHC